jgi:hypothetical protein
LQALPVVPEGPNDRYHVLAEAASYKTDKQKNAFVKNVCDTMTANKFKCDTISGSGCCVGSGCPTFVPLDQLQMPAFTLSS